MTDSTGLHDVDTHRSGVSGLDRDRSAVRDVIIVGSGPAGYTAALYSARAELSPLLFEGTQYGGALMTTTEVENFPGFPAAVMGPDLMEKMREQAERFGADIRSEDVSGMDLTGEIKTVTAGGETYRAWSVIVATGSAYRYLGLPSEQRLLGHGVSACATCDGFFFKDQDIVVVGGGDSAMEEATFLTRFGQSVTVIHRRDTLRASKIMQDRAEANPKIRFIWDTEVTEVLGGDSVTGVRLRNVKTGRESERAAGGVFIAIGHEPRTELVRGQLDLDDAGYIVVHAPTTATSLEGVFAAGDVVDHIYRQAITAAGTGCAAALDAERWLAARDEAGEPARSTAQTTVAVV